MKQAPKAANSNAIMRGLWFVCACGSGLFGVKLDEQTKHHHVICEQCGADNTMTIFS